MKKVLYISYDGMTDPLGQSQVLPYIIGLSKKGYQFTLLSAEKPEKYEKYKGDIQKIVNAHGIRWETIPFSSNIPILSKIKDLRKLKKTAKSLHKEANFDLVHCRSYVSVEAGLMLHKAYGTDYLFDMRGFWVDERVDGGIWNLRNPVYKWAYKYYKKKEKEFLKHSSHVISLTEAAKSDLSTWKDIGNAEVSVIPCSADFNVFKKADPESKINARKELRIENDSLVISYLGSIGTWYLMDEMLDFFKILKTRYPKAIFLFLTPENPDTVLSKAKSKGLEPSSFKVLFSKREKVNFYLSACDLSLFFIKQCYSKISSSPTKQGEILAMGIPVITNSKIGDVDSIIQENTNGIVIDHFDHASYEKAIDSIPGILSLNPDTIREQARDYYGLEKAVRKYETVYDKILNRGG